MYYPCYPLLNSHLGLFLYKKGSAGLGSKDQGFIGLVSSYFLQLIVPDKIWRHTIKITNDLQYTFILTNGKMYTGLSSVICIVWRHFL